MQDLQLDETRKGQLDANIKKMLEGGATQDDVIKYASDFKGQFGVKKNESFPPGGKDSGKPSPSPSPSTSRQPLSLGPQFGNEMFQTMGQQPAIEEKITVEEKSPMVLPTPSILRQKNKSFFENDVDVSLNFSLKNPALSKTKDKIALSAPRKQDGSPSLDMPFKEQVAMQKRQITSDPTLLKEYGRSRMQQIGELANNFSSAGEEARKTFLGEKTLYVDNDNSTALKNKAAELQDYQKQFKESLKTQAAISVTQKALQLGQKLDPIQIGREVLDVISDPTLNDDEKVLAELKNPSDQVFLNPHGGAEVSKQQYDLKAADKSQQNINYNLYRTGAYAMKEYYDEVRESAFNKSPDKIKSLTSLLDTWGNLTPEEQKNTFNPVNAQIQSLRQDPAVNEFIDANINFAKADETASKAIKQFPQVARMDKISALNEAWFNLSNAKASGGAYGSELPRVWRWMFGDKPSENDIPSIARAAGVTKEEAEQLINEGGTGFWHVLAPTVRTSGFFPGMARGANATIDNTAMGIRRFFDPTSAATETRNRIEKDRMDERDTIAQGNMLKDDAGSWHINPMSIANVFGYGMGQTAIMAAPALASGGLAAEGSMLSKGLELVNTVVPGAAASYEDAWKTAKNNGADDSTAKAYAFWVSLANGGAQAIYSPADVIKGISGGPSKKLLFSTFMKDLETKGMNKTISSQIRNVGSEIWNTAKEPLNVLTAENVEEFATDAAVNQLDEHYLGLKKTQAQLADQTFTTFIQTTFQTLPLAIGVGIGGTRDMSGVRKQALFEVGKQPDLYKSMTKDLLDQQKITQAEYNTKLSHINQLQGIVATLPKQNAHGKQLSYDESAEITAQQFRIDTNEQKLKNGTIAGEKPIIEADSKEAIKRQGEILNPELSEKVMYQGSEWTVKKDNGDTVDIVKDDGLSFLTINKSELGNLKTKEDEKVIFPVRNNDFAEKYFSKESPSGEESEFARYQRLKDENEDAAADMITNKKEEIIAATELPKGSPEKITQPIELSPEITTTGTKTEELKLTDKKKDILDEVTDEKIGEKEYQDFSIDFSDGARAFGKIEDGVASIAGINAPKNDGGVVRGTKTYERVLDQLSAQGVKTISVKLQSNDSSKAIDKLIEKGILTNPRDVIGSSGNERATTFDIGTKSEQQTPSTVKSEFENSIDAEQKGEFGKYGNMNLKGSVRELWEMPYKGKEGQVKTGDLGVTEKGELGTAINMMEMQPAMIKDALNEGKYEEAIKNGTMSAGYAKRIIESAGLEVPQDIVIDAGLQEKNLKNETTQDTKQAEPNLVPAANESGVTVIKPEENVKPNIIEKSEVPVGTEEAVVTEEKPDSSVREATEGEGSQEAGAPPVVPPVGETANAAAAPNDRDKEDLVINRVLSRRVMAENYPTLFKENIVKQQDTAITQGEKQDREVSGDYVAALESDLRGVSVQSAMELKATLGDEWDMKTLDFIERSFAYNQQPGNPAQVAGILNIISTKNFQEIRDTRDANKLGQLAVTQMRIDKAALEVSRDASLTLNMRRLYGEFAKGGSMADELAQEMILTKTQQKFRDQLAELLITPPTEQEINEAPRPKKPKKEKVVKEKTASPKKENSKATKEQIILEGAKTAENKSFRDYIRDAKEKLKNIKC